MISDNSAHPARKPCTRSHHHLFLSPSSRPLNVLQLYCRRCQWRILNSSLRRRRAEQVWLQSYSKINVSWDVGYGKRNIKHDSSEKQTFKNPIKRKAMAALACPCLNNDHIIDKNIDTCINHLAFNSSRATTSLTES